MHLPATLRAGVGAPDARFATPPSCVCGLTRGERPGKSTVTPMPKPLTCRPFIRQHQISLRPFTSCTSLLTLTLDFDDLYGLCGLRAVICGEGRGWRGFIQRTEMWYDRACHAAWRVGAGLGGCLDGRGGRGRAGARLP